MNDLIKREDVLKYVDSWLSLDEYYHPESKKRNIPYAEVRQEKPNYGKGWFPVWIVREDDICKEDVQYEW